MIRMATVNAQVKDLIQKEVKRQVDAQGLAGMTGETAKATGDGLIEQQIKRVRYQYNAYTANIIQAGKSTMEFAKGVFFGKEKMDESATILTKLAVKMVTWIPIIKAVQDKMNAGALSFASNAKNMGLMAKAGAALSMVFTALWAGLGAILMVVGGLILVFGLLSVALQGAASPFVEWFNGLGILGKIATILGVIIGALKIFGGAWSLIILGVVGIIRVLTQEMGFVEALITTLVSIVATLGGAFLMFGAAAVSPFILIGSAVVGIGLLIWKFWDDIVQLPKKLLNAIKAKFTAMNNWLREWYSGSMLKAIVDRVKAVTRTIRGVLGGKSLSDAVHDSGVKTYGHTININVNGSADSSTAREIASQTSYALRQNDRRQGGSSTTGAFVGA